ncbi:MAG TPA: UdgX family uracil-DNA binding protein [Candidatus Baltobacteraceae bacterium]|jgi:DNA polymerase
MKARTAAQYLPKRLSLRALREDAAQCRGCDLYKHATQTVFGEGPKRARVMFVGEQPGDSEDRTGHPFVGPAGRVLRDAMERAGIAIEDAYVTNAVKHFKFVTRGKRRIHSKPRTIEIRACEPWLQAEIAVVKPAIVVALGATAAQALLGPKFRLTPNRGRVLEGLVPAAAVIATVHPSSILRAPDSATRHRELAKFEEDLRVVAEALESLLAQRGEVP